jgi:CHC2 zinc finger
MSATTLRDPVMLFGCYLDLAPLRHHRHGLVRCIFHEDRTGSLSIDLDKGVFHCFGCGAQGGMRDFAIRVGEARDDHARPMPQPGASPKLTAFAEALRRDREQTARMAKWAPVFRRADVIRAFERVVDTLRARATAAGPDGPTTLDMLERAARIERAVGLLDMDVDAARREASGQ